MWFFLVALSGSSFSCYQSAHPKGLRNWSKNIFCSFIFAIMVLGILWLLTTAVNFFRKIQEVSKWTISENVMTRFFKTSKRPSFWDILGKNPFSLVFLPPGRYKLRKKLICQFSGKLVTDWQIYKLNSQVPW